MKVLALTNGMTTMVDDDNYDQFCQYTWNAMIRGRWVAATRTAYVNGKKRTIYLHREIMSAPGGALVDHRNGDALDNRRVNLRFCTVAQNQANRRVAVSQSGYKGVRLFRRNLKKPWAASLKVAGVMRHLGYFASARDAANAYDKASVCAFGEFAATNATLFPNGA